MVHLRRLALTLTMTILILVTLFPSYVKADIQLSQEFVEPIKNWSFETCADTWQAGGVRNCPPWSTNNGGWRDLRGDVTGPEYLVPDGVVDMRDIALIANHFGAEEGKPNYDIRFDITADGRIDIRDVALASSEFGKTTNRIGGVHSWYTSGGGDYQMWQYLDSDTMNKVKGNEITFSFWFLPESVAPDGLQNYARAEIFVYLLGYGGWWEVGDWVYPTEKKWHSAFVSAFIPETVALVRVRIHGKPDFKAWIDQTSLSISETKLVVDADSRSVSLAVNLFTLKEDPDLPDPCRAVLGVAMCANDPHSDYIWIDYTQIKVKLISGSFVRIANVTQSNDANYVTDPEQTQEIENKWIVAGQVAVGAIVTTGVFVISYLAGIPPIASLFLDVTIAGVVSSLMTYRSDANDPYAYPADPYAKAKLLYGGAPDFANERCTLELGFNSGTTCQVEITAKARFVTLAHIFPYPIVTVSTLETSILATVSL